VLLSLTFCMTKSIMMMSAIELMSYEVTEQEVWHMAQMGRPKSDVLKEKVVSVRMLPEEYDKVKKYADDRQKTVTEVMQEGVTKLIAEDK